MHSEDWLISVKNPTRLDKVAAMGWWVTLRSWGLLFIPIIGDCACLEHSGDAGPRSTVWPYITVREQTLQTRHRACPDMEKCPLRSSVRIIYFLNFQGLWGESS